MDLLELALRREAIIALAIGGAVIATLGSYLARPSSTANAHVAKFLLRTGYGVTFASIALFIIAGYWGNR